MVAVGPDGRQAWAVSITLGQAALTEIWVDDQRPRRLGVFLGKSGGLVWQGNRILFQDVPLSLPEFGVNVAGRRAWALAPSGVWELSPEGGEARRLEPGEANVVFQTDEEEAPKYRVSNEAQAVLAGVDEAINAASAAYGALHAWAYSSAKTRYLQAAETFKSLPKRFSGAGVFRKVCEGYERELKARAVRADKVGSRWVCGEHMQVVGDLLQAYRAANEDRRPSDLKALWTWVEASGATKEDMKAMERLFTSSKDWEPGRVLSYYYRPLAAEGEAIVTSFFHPGYLVELVCAGEGYRVVDRKIGQAQIDSLMDVGETYYQMPSDSTQAIRVFEMVTGVAPKFAPGHCRLGYSYLKANRLDRAIRSLEQAVFCDDELAEAYCGLGLVFRKRPRGFYDAIRYFQKALQFDREYVEARYNIAELRYLQGELDAKKDADKVIELNPNYAPVYLLMGMWYEDLRKDYENAALYYAQYMSLRPGDKEGRRRLAGVYLRSQNYDRILALLEEYARQHPEEYELLPVLAQACIKLESYERASAYYQSYLAQVAPTVRALYEDVRLVASREELDAIRRAGEESRTVVLRRFWAERDPDLTTAANERQLEHYRRIWFSIQNFSNGQKPWDMRGEVYVRFGEPDHRSTSDSYNLEQSLEVQRVKERLAEELYGTRTDPGAFLRSTLTEGSNVVDQAGFFMPPSESSFFPGPVFPVRSMRSSISEAAGFTSAAYNEDGSGGNAGVNDVGVSTSRSGPTLNYAPVSSRGDVSMVAWESWVYTGIGGGIEITFTDEFGKGIYGFAPVPLEASVPVRQLAKLSRYSPENVVLQAARSTPDYYEAPENKNPLGFYYDLADFQGIGRQTALEVYMGIPHNMGKYMVDEKATRIEVERSVGLLNLATGAVYRQDGVIRFEGKGNLTNDRTSFVPDAVRMEVPPGRYRMEVQARDRLSRSRSRYRQEILVDPYGTERFQVSDLELAWKIEEGHSEGVFQKGELQVVPMPTRAYGRGQSVFVYYEVYNLQKDDFGRTKYQVSYTIGPKNGSPLGGVISSLVRLGRGKQQTVAVAYEQEGDATTEVEYVGLELGNIAPDQYVLKVTVTDLNSEEAVVKEAGFMVAQ